MSKTNGRLRRVADELGCSLVRNAKHGAIYRTPDGRTVLVSCSPKDIDTAEINLRKAILKNTPRLNHA
jgi:hypothetical protein